MNFIKKLLKKRKLLKKYNPSSKQNSNNHMYLLQSMRGDYEFMKYYYWIRSCEITCYKRLKALR